MIDCSDFVWEVEQLRIEFTNAEVMIGPNHPNLIVAVYPTGSGK